MRKGTGSAMSGLFGATRLLAVVAALIAFMGVPMSTSAEGSVERYVFYLSGSASKSLTDLCVGDVVAIDVKAERFVSNRRGSGTDQTTNPPVQVFGVTIDGSVGNPEVGSLFFTRQITTAQSSPPGSAKFKFTATKAGSTSIVFKGTSIATGWFDRFVNGNRDYLSTEMDVTVKNCEYSVTATTNWHNFGLDYTAVVSDIRLVSTGGGLYRGSGTYTFIITDNPKRDPCGPHTRTYQAQVDVTGGLDGDQLEVGIDYGHPTGEWRIYLTFECTVTSREQLTVFPEPLNFTIPASGISITYQQTLKDITNLPIYETPNGLARVTVVPVAPR
jgi:hypothetical protein